MAEAKRHGAGLPLRPTLLSVVVMLILGGAGGVGFIAYSSSRGIVDKLWNDLARQLVTATTQRTLRYFAPARPYIELTRRQAETRRLLVGPFDAETEPRGLLDYFRAAIEANPNFTWASFGGVDGTYVAAYRRKGGAIRAVWRTARAGKPTIMRVLAPDAHHGWRIVRRYDGSYTPVGRPWFAKARAQKDGRGVWVEPFVFATVKQPGFMYAWAYHPKQHAGDFDPRAAKRAAASQPAHRQTAGVFAVEYEMSELSTFLSTLRVGKSGRVFVVTDKGEVVGHPQGQTTEKHGGKLRVARAATHPDEMLRSAWTALRRRKNKLGDTFAVGRYLAMAHAFPPDTGIDWRVLVVVPESDFFGELRAQALQTLLIALAAAALAIVLGAVFSNRVSSALRVIADDLERIGRFELEGRALEQKQESFVREINEMRQTTLKMKRSLRSFGKYVPKELVRELIVSGAEAELGGRKAELTVLFSDIAGFTTVAEKLEPDVLVELLGEYLEAMSAAIRECGGTVDKYIGDAIMAFWGAPRDSEAHALSACRGALAMRRRLREKQALWDARALPRFDTRIGINTGEMLVGNFGAPDRLNYTVIGDPVNLASRLEALNKQYGTQIIIGERTAKLVGEAFVLRPLDFVAVKGKDDAVRVFELVGETGQVDDETLAAVEAYSDALEHYRARRFAEAHAALEPLADAGDAAARQLVARCQAYEVAPPPDDWDGRTTMTSK
ncbi:MAG: hypothetical protein KC503_34380 [Myxococcales bacterium]|nr:hypothetical protein [Myxococcales bacterium]